MSDLLISYSSHDRPWADRLYRELRASYPTLDIFLDHESIPAGGGWRQILIDTARDTRNLVVLWSDQAKVSNEVGPEIQAFEQNKLTNPLDNGLRRTLFYLPLQGDYGPLNAIQSFVKLRERALYDPLAPDRGTARLDERPFQPVWNECVRWIGDNIARQNQVTLAILAMNSSIVNLLDPYHNIQTLAGHPTLAELLASFGLNLADVKKRYGSNAFEWRPFGTEKTVIDVMEEARKETNPTLDEEFRFQWKELDLYGETVKMQKVEPIIQRLNEGPSALVVDPISLQNVVIKPLFDKLGDYFNRQDSVVISLAPVENAGLEPLLMWISEKTGSLLTPYFKPYVPAAGTFAGCGLNLGHRLELMRYMRHGLGLHYLKRKRQDESELVRMR